MSTPKPPDPDTKRRKAARKEQGLFNRWIVAGYPWFFPDEEAKRKLQLVAADEITAELAIIKTGLADAADCLGDQGCFVMAKELKECIERLDKIGPAIVEDYSTLITMAKVWKLGGEYPDPDPIRPGLQSTVDGSRQQELSDFITNMLQELQCFVFQSPPDTNQEDN